MLHNIPFELQQLDQWVVATGAVMPDGKRNKIPLNPRTGARADSTDRSSWGSFSEAQQCGYPLVGFVLSKEDPYCIIDLDAPETEDQIERHSKILEAFESYAEVSQSGNGVHIICRGSVPHGVRRDKVEIYSDARYMICTGVIYKALPIVDCQPLLDIMFAEMNAEQPSVELKQIDGVLGDQAVYEMALNAANGHKFDQLWQGNWQGVAEWPSQSEADFALLSMLGFYTKDNDQVRRLFRWSALGKREKATRNNKYIDFALQKIRAKEMPLINLDRFLNKYNAPIPNQTEVEATGDSGGPNISGEEETRQGDGSVDGEVSTIGGASSGQSDGTSALEYPPGFIGELAAYFYSSAIRPVPEIALASAIALCAGVAGRAYNISGSGLNQYLVVIARTGSGKEGGAKGIDMMIKAVRSQIPMVDQFIGPAAFASGQGLLRALDKKTCFVSVLGEVGLTLQSICDQKASDSQRMLLKVLLDIYAKSGFDSLLQPNVYSESDKNTRVVQAPNVTIFGESTPDSFYDGLDGSAIAKGLVPRFSIFEYDGPRPSRNRHAYQPPPKALVDKFAALITVGLLSEQQRVFCPVQISAEAQALLDAFDEKCDTHMRQSNFDVNLQLWNRGHLKALKMSALIAVGENPHQPIVTPEGAQWAISLTERDITKLLKHFAAGDIGTGDTRMEADLRRAVNDFLAMSRTTKIDYNVPGKLLEVPVVPLGFLRRRLRGLASYRNDRRGANAALSAILKAMTDAGELQQVPPIQATQLFGISTPLYVTGDNW